MTDSMERLIDDIVVLEHAVEPNDDYMPIQDVVRQYLAANAEFIAASIEAWRRLGQRKRSQLEKLHNELHVSVVVDQFYEIARLPLDLALKPDGVWNTGLFHITADHLHVLARVLRYAKYAPNGTTYTLQMQPLSAYLPARR